MLEPLTKEQEENLSTEERIRIAEQRVNETLGDPVETPENESDPAILDDDSVQVLTTSEDATPEEKELEALARVKVMEKLTAMESKRNKLENEAEALYKEADEYSDKIQELTLCKAIADGAFSVNNWGLDVSKKDFFSILWTTPDRHPELARIFASRPTHPLIKFDGLVLQLVSQQKQILLYADKEDQILVDWVKEHGLKVSLLTMAELADQHRKYLNVFMRAIKDFENVADRAAIDSALSVPRKRLILPNDEPPVSMGGLGEGMPENLA